MDVETTRLEENRYEKGYPPGQGPVTTAEAIRTTLLNRISWSAVFAGVVIAFAAQIILNLIGVSIGAATIMGQAPEATGISLGAAIWYGISGILAAFAGGYTAGRLSGEPEKTTASWHGLVSWAASIIVVALFMTTAAGAALAGPVQQMVGLTGMTGDVSAQAVDTGSAAVAIGALSAAIALILGAVAGWFGGRAGTVEVSTLRSNAKSDVVH